MASAGWLPAPLRHGRRSGFVCSGRDLHLPHIRRRVASSRRCGRAQVTRIRQPACRLAVAGCGQGPARGSRCLPPSHAQGGLPAEPGTETLCCRRRCAGMPDGAHSSGAPTPTISSPPETEGSKCWSQSNGNPARRKESCSLEALAVDFPATSVQTYAREARAGSESSLLPSRMKVEGLAF